MQNWGPNMAGDAVISVLPGRLKILASIPEIYYKKDFSHLRSFQTDSGAQPGSYSARIWRLFDRNQTVQIMKLHLVPR